VRKILLAVLAGLGVLIAGCTATTTAEQSSSGPSTSTNPPLASPTLIDGPASRVLFSMEPGETAWFGPEVFYQTIDQGKTVCRLDSSAGIVATGPSNPGLLGSAGAHPVRVRLLPSRGWPVWMVSGRFELADGHELLAGHELRFVSLSADDEPHYPHGCPR
jgi:hypothetical protein